MAHIRPRLTDSDAADAACQKTQAGPPCWDLDPMQRSLWYCPPLHPTQLRAALPALICWGCCCTQSPLIVWDEAIRC
jgi:hypothetical protein